MKHSTTRVYVVEDDPSMRNALKNLLKSLEFEAELFASAEEFLLRDRPEVPSCLILDVRLPGVGGLDLQTQLRSANIQIPIIFVTAHGDIPMSVRAMKAGAAEFLTKPFRSRSLLDAVQAAIERDRSAHKERSETQDLRARYEQLTPREREVLPLITSGM